MNGCFVAKLFKLETNLGKETNFGDKVEFLFIL